MHISIAIFKQLEKYSKGCIWFFLTVKVTNEGKNKNLMYPKKTKNKSSLRKSNPFEAHCKWHPEDLYARSFQ